MNPPFTGMYFDGEMLFGHPVQINATGGRLCITGAGIGLEVPLAEVRFSAKLARLPYFIYLPGNRSIESACVAAIDALLAQQRQGRLNTLIHWLESRSRIAAAATLLLVSSAIAVAWLGLPVLARRTAMAVPDRLELEAGQAALLAFNRFLGPSQLPPKERRRIEKLRERLLAHRQFSGAPPLEFRSMGGKNPNAFALPGGIIIVSDELVKLAGNDEELLAVLAHELGHVAHRHGMQSVLRSSATLLLVSTLTGDLSTLTTFSGTLPFLLLQRGYTREFEQEADDYATQLLDERKIGRRHFVSILAKLQRNRPAEGLDYSYLSTHPSTEDRMQRIDPAAAVTASLAAHASGSTPSAPVPHIPSDEPQEEVKIAPKVLSQPLPEYPFDLRAAGIEGVVTVRFVVDGRGNVREPEIVKSTHGGFEAAALEAVAKWKFSPGMVDGKSVNSRMQIDVAFKLSK